MRSRHIVEEGRNDRRSIVLTAIPYQVGKNGLVEKIAEAAKDKRIEGVSTFATSRTARACASSSTEARRHARCRPEPALAPHAGPGELPGQHARHPRRPPETLTLRDIIEAFVRFREEVITRRTKFELNRRASGRTSCSASSSPVTNLDEVVRIIRGSASPAEARAALLARDWPVAEIAPYIALVEAVEHEVEGDSYRLPTPRCGHPRASPPPPHRPRPRRDRRRAAGARRRSTSCSTSSATG
jgi:DNA gyrase subunit A